MTYSKLLEPRSERAGIFSEEVSLKSALKEMSNSNLSIKSSTRGYSLLYDKKVANPAIAGKRRAQIEEILHNVHWRFIKNLAKHHLKKQGFILIEVNEKENQVDLVFSKNAVKNENQQQIIKISCSKKKWEVMFEASGIDDPPSQKFISSLLARIGKSSM